MHYFVGDVPAEDVVIEPARGGYAIDLALFDTATVEFRAPDGHVVESSGFLATIDDTTVVVEWPAETVLDDPGVYELALILEGTDDVRERVTPERIVVEEQGTGWYTLDLARADWDDAPDSDLVLHDLLDAAQHAVVTYAPALVDGAHVPTSYRKGQLMQARNVWNVDEGEPADASMGLSPFSVTPKPLDWQIKQLLRPKSATPVMG